jgi:hypothetical protein
VMQREILGKAFGGDLGLGFDLGLTYYPKRTFSLQPVFLMYEEAYENVQRH